MTAASAQNWERIALAYARRDLHVFPVHAIGQLLGFGLARAIAGQALRQVAAELSNCESAEPQEAFSGHRGG